MGYEVYTESIDQAAPKNGGSTPVAMHVYDAVAEAFVPRTVTSPIFATETQLTAPGSTDARSVEDGYSYGYAFTVAAINTSVDIQLEGSADETNYSVLTLEDSTTVGLTITGNVATVTANGTYVVWTEVPIKDLKLTFGAEIGGTAATIDATFMKKRRS